MSLQLKLKIWVLIIRTIQDIKLYKFKLLYNYQMSTFNKIINKIINLYNNIFSYNYDKIARIYKFFN
jgi:hypothetical protein